MKKQIRPLGVEVLEDRALLNASPEIIANINQALGNASSSPDSFVVVGDTMFFVASDAEHGREIWKTDGTGAGTVLVKDIGPGSLGSYPSNLTNVNGTLFFSAFDGTNGRELWKSDGTEQGTVLFKDIQPGSIGSYPEYLTNVNGTLFFSAFDGTNGRELWRSDGTEQGTVLVKDIRTGSGSSFASHLTNIDGTLFFVGNTIEKTGELFGLGPVLFGTSGNDSINIRVDDGFQVTINGRDYFYPGSELSVVGLGGSDTVRVVGTPGDEVLSATPNTFEFSGANFLLSGSETEYLTVLGNGGDDFATLMDSPGVERVVAIPNNTFVREVTRAYSHRVRDFGDILLVSSGSAPGNFDLANLVDSAGSDIFVGNATNARITGPGYRVRTEGYDRNIARSVRGGEDVAILNGTENGNENFTARVTANPARNFGALRSGPGAPQAFLNRATGFASVRANSNGGNDRAFLFDGSGDDEFLGNATLGQLSGAQFLFMASEFKRVNVRATNGGNDSATLIDSPGNDRLRGVNNLATMFGASGSYTHATVGFEQVTGVASEGGTDTLSLATNIAFAFFEVGTWEIK